MSLKNKNWRRIGNFKKIVQGKIVVLTFTSGKPIPTEKSIEYLKKGEFVWDQEDKNLFIYDGQLPNGYRMIFSVPKTKAIEGWVNK